MLLFLHKQNVLALQLVLHNYFLPLSLVQVLIVLLLLDDLVLVSLIFQERLLLLMIIETLVVTIRLLSLRRLCKPGHRAELLRHDYRPLVVVVSLAIVIFVFVGRGAQTDLDFVAAQRGHFRPTMWVDALPIRLGTREVRWVLIAVTTGYQVTALLFVVRVGLHGCGRAFLALWGVLDEFLERLLLLVDTLFLRSLLPVLPLLGAPIGR